MLQEFLPETSLFTPNKLWEDLERFSDVILKPSGGGGGAGLFHLKKMEDEKIRVHHGRVKRELTGKEQTVAYVRSRFIPKPYILQPRIQLGQINGRPFDIRVMIQRRRGTPWRITGVLAKVAGPGFVVTNIKRSGGKVLPFYAAVKQSNITEEASVDLVSRVKQVALRVAARLAKSFPNRFTIGLDMGIDVDGKPWIIEANFRPALSLFHQLPNQASYQLMRSYIKK